MKRIALVLLALLLLVGAVAAFLVYREASRAPAGTAPPREMLPRVPPDEGESRISLVATLPLDDLRDVVEQRVPERVVELEGEPAKGDWRYDLTVLRTGAPELRGTQDGRLVVEVPLALEAKAYRGRKAARRERRGADAPKGIVLEAGIALELSIDYRIASDWSADPQVQVHHRWTGEPVLALGPFSFPVKRQVEKKLVPKLDQAAQRIRAQLMEQDTLRARIEQAWTELQQPRPLQGGAGWLAIEPSSLAMRSPSVQGDALTIPVVLQGRITILVGAPPPPVQPGPLPARLDPDGPEGVRIAVAVELPWDVLASRVRESLRERTFESQVGTLRVEDVQLYPSGDRIALGFDLMAQTTGVRQPATVWFLGRPVLDPEARAVRIEDFDYSLKARASWLDTVNHAALREALREQIEPRLVFSYGDQADAALERVRNRPERGGLTLDLDAVEVVGIGSSEEALVLQAVLTGSGAARIAGAPLVPDP